MSKRLCLCWVIVLFLIACNKEDVIVKPVTGNNLSQATTSGLDTSKSWYGLYNFYYQSPDDTTYHTLSDKYIIANGKAKFPYVKDASVFFIKYDIPSSHIIYGDDATFDISLQDSSAVMNFDLIGTKNTASFDYFAYNDSGYYTVALGSVVKQIKLFPTTDYNNFKLVQFVFKQTKAYVYVANKLITSFAYGTSNKMGNVKQISLGNSGYLACDYVRLYNSYNQRPVMDEEFNIDGKSHTIFY